MQAQTQTSYYFYIRIILYCIVGVNYPRSKGFILYGSIPNLYLTKRRQIRLNNCSRQSLFKFLLFFIFQRNTWPAFLAYSCWNSHQHLAACPGLPTAGEQHCLGQEHHEGALPILPRRAGRGCAAAVWQLRQGVPYVLFQAGVGECTGWRLVLLGMCQQSYR